MASARLVLRSSRLAPTLRLPTRTFTTTPSRLADEPAPYDYAAINARTNDTSEAYRKFQMQRPLNPHMTNTNSTIANEMPAIGKDNAPPELITHADPGFVPKDSVPENTERMTGGTQKPEPEGGVNAELNVGEIEGGSFRVEPIRRVGEDAGTMRARLVYQSRKRGTLESDLLLSTFADQHLGSMTPSQLQQYDLFLDENDWDIYYWATQEPTPSSMGWAEGAGPEFASPEAQGTSPPGQAPAEATASASGASPGPAGAQSFEEVFRQDKPRSGEWVQTVGTFKPAYRPVPQRWKNSEILSMLRKHVKDRSAGDTIQIEGASAAEVGGSEHSGKGMGFMPELRNYDRA